MLKEWSLGTPLFLCAEERNPIGALGAQAGVHFRSLCPPRTRAGSAEERADPWLTEVREARGLLRGEKRMPSRSWSALDVFSGTRTGQQAAGAKQPGHVVMGSWTRTSST
ncbi:hypothetical protein NDU88_006553 [Pleurodeles waltl]|uniref:Uncharacterized protein n=1 Tax=Pleurodeles waltl TaxID=8319 RepID=A0AAV7PK25_PLEWA|nr:hypothetical protein NDU88_006553 [Pleurodeles waltl]